MPLAEIEAPLPDSAPPREYLSFRLGAESYGVDILKVQEIRSYEGVTRIPGAPEFIKGVINLRGAIVPVLDLRLRFGLAAEYNSFTVMIVLNLGGRTVGIVVDGVSDVLQLAAEQLRAPPELGAAVRADCILGLATVDDRLLILLDIERLLADAELGLPAPRP